MMSTNIKNDISQLSMACDLGIEEKQLRRIEKGGQDVQYETFYKIFEYCKDVDKDITMEKLLETVGF